MATRTLEERLNGADPEAWIPEEAGESIFGEVESVVTREGDYGEYPLVTLLTNDGDVWNVAGFGTVLHNKIVELDPQEGDLFGVKFLGEKTSKGGKTYKDWRVVVQRAPKAAVTATSDDAVDDFPDDDI